jgi:lysozyme
VRVPFRGTYSTAAGRYQFLARTWDTLKRRLNLPDFGPDSQDAAALELIRERGALSDVQAGRVAVAVGKVQKIWASLPGAGYSQPERSINQLTAAYVRAGGTLEQS